MTTAKEKFALQIHPDDNVLVALKDLPKGLIVRHKNEDIVLQEPIAAKHKFFIKDMQQGDNIYMYGVLVGQAQKFISKGSWMSTENTKHAAELYSYKNISYQWKSPDVSKFLNKTFKGYHRPDGRVGTANYWLFIPTVFCENRNLDVIKEALHASLGYAVTDKYRQFAEMLADAYQNKKDIENIDLSVSQSAKHRLFKNIDGIKFLNHSGGCGGTRQDSVMLGKLLASYADHPNVAGITLLSLGCQHLQTNDLIDEIKRRNPEFNKPMLVFEQQKSQSEESTLR